MFGINNIWDNIPKVMVLISKTTEINYQLTNTDIFV